MRENFFNYIERQIQTIRLFSINIQAHLCFCSRFYEFDHPLDHFINNSFALDVFISWVQGRELYRDTRVLTYIAKNRILRQSLNRIKVGRVITLRVFFRAGAFTKHVKRIGVAF